MKKLRFNFAILILLFLTMPILQSCLDLDNDNEQTYLAIGTLSILEGKDYYFALDDGKKMYPSDTTSIRNYPLVNEQRVIVNFLPLEEKINGYDYNAKVLSIQDLLTKDIITMTESTADSIGDDRINITEMWITGNYLNIKYQYLHNNDPQKRHMLNLVINETNAQANDDTNFIALEFRHNAFDDEQRVPGWGVVSFKLNNIDNLINGKQGLKVRYKSIYEDIKYATINFKQPK